ncbi:substrate-binding domain-containing protein [Colwellia demingiae]|uniref:substrate-binding domain-containing protein n=1 Tax=Colwellia demingiae TaxID=89401 RepID=UPI001B877A6D|nr:substrate-binding domain-containing protein [Colwellia demingiae]
MIKTIKKTLLAAAILTTTSNIALADDSLVIGAPMSSFADKWLSYLFDGIRDFDTKHDDVIFKLTDANDDPGKMLNDVDNFIDSGVDALLVVPTDIATVKPIAKKAKRAGIPLIIINRLPDEKTMKSVDAYVGSESIEAGIIQAESVVGLLDGQSANILLLLGPMGQEAQIYRTEGNKQVFAKYPNIKIVAEHEGRWDRAKALQIVEDVLQAHPEINVIVANNDEMAIGALLAATKAGKTDADLIISGIDATPDALEYLGKGLDTTVFQSAKGQGYGGAEIAYKLSKGQKVKKMNWIDFELVDKSQKEAYLLKY